MDGIGRGISRSKLRENFLNAWRLRALVMLAIVGAFGSLYAQTPITAGYRDLSYSTADIAEITGEKPESKLWWNDGYWWASLWSNTAIKYRIHRFDVAAQSWIEVGPDIDDRDRSLADALWDGEKLYVASHIYSSHAGITGTSNSARLYRYSYNSAADTYSLDAGFPILINSSKSETLVLDKDSTGRLWITWTEGGKVYVNCSQGSDLTWGTPFILPVQSSDVDLDDIATLIAFNNHIGVIWSNQLDLKIYFASHRDGEAETLWQAREVALEDPSLGAVADDHLNLKMTDDSGGNLYVVSKTSLSGSTAPGVYLLKRTFGGSWSSYVVARRADDYTRPIVVLDDENREAYVFAKSDYGVPGTIRMKKVGFDNPAFPAGVGTAFIQSTTDNAINNPSSAKHNVNSTTGLLVIASDGGTRYYFHNYLALPSTAPTITSFAPVSGPVGTVVMITGNKFNGVPQGGVKFNGVAASFTVNSNTQITATVPVAATTGKISVTTSAGTGISAGDFTVTPTQYFLTVNVVGSGSVDPPSGTYDAGMMITLTATPAAGYQFSGWSGDLTGSTNPATITMDGDKNVTATFTAIAGSGQVVHEETQTGGSSSSTTVTTAANLTAASGHLYLAAIAKKSNVAVTSVSGLGLNWTLVKAQCSGRNQTGVEVWMAQGTPGGNGSVTAAFASAPSNAVIAVSRYSGIDAANPLGNVISGNTKGVNGACSGGSDNSAYSFSLVTTVSGAMVYGAATMRDKTHSPGAGYTERAELAQGATTGSKASIAVQDQSFAAVGTATLNGSFSASVDWAVVGLEIKPAAGVVSYTLTTNVSGSGSVNPSGGTYAAGTVVTLTATPNAGYQFSGWSGDLSGSANPATITMSANKNITATFTVLPPIQYALTVNTSGAGSVALNPAGGVYNAGTVVTLTATPNSGYQFSGWSGDLSSAGGTNPATITMDGNKNVTATFTLSAGGIQVVHEETQTGGSSSATTVTTSSSLTGASGHLYLAAIATKAKVTVTSVAGLGLNWTLVKSQCAGRNQTGVEVWMAQGTPSGNGTVTATLASAPGNAVIAVSRYSGVAAANPLGNVISGNTVGVNGACSGGTDNSAYSFSLATTPQGGTVVYGAATMRDKTHSPGAGYTERAELAQGATTGSKASVAVQDQNFASAPPSGATVNGSFSGNVDWAMIAVEIKPQNAASKSFASFERAAPQAPAAYQLEQNYPNPFSTEGRAPGLGRGNLSTVIGFALPEAGKVTVKIYTETGQLVRTLVDGEMAAGRHARHWNGRNESGHAVAAGVYLYRIIVAGQNGEAVFSKTQRMTLVK
jgi:uncharacterized repeat protein (TIGR02543 family)